MSVEKQLFTNQPKRLKNSRCAYCNAEFTGPNEPQKEHVVGRKFVPAGVHNQQWNLHLNACNNCNQDKSKLENDLSAITMIDYSRTNSVSDLQRKEAIRKSKAKSQRTGKAVKDSQETFEVSADLGKAILTIQCASPPQFDNDRAFELARYQLAGFFFFLTFNDETNTGYPWPGVFTPIGALQKNDWANPLATSFSAIVKDWGLRLSGGNIARGYFRAVIKECPDVSLWSWAIEWNRTTRLFGFMGDESATQEILGKLSYPSWGPWIEQPAGNKIRYRYECPLEASDEDLFFYSK